MAHGPALAATADAVDEIGDDFASARGVDDFGMELQAKKLPGAVLDGGVFGIFGDGDRFEIGGQLGELVAVGIPHLQGLGQLGKERAGTVFHREGAFAVLAFLAFFHAAAEEVGE